MQDLKKKDDDRDDDAEFGVNGKDVNVTVNVMMPGSKLKMHGGDEDNESKKTTTTFTNMAGRIGILQSGMRALSFLT